MGIVVVLLGACSAASTPTATPQLQIIGDVPTQPATEVAAIATATASPTPLPSRTPLPTAPRVVVSRVNEDIDPAQVIPIAQGAPLPDLSLTDIDGQTLRLTDFAQQGRPLVLNFWSLGCGSCFYEFPILQEFAAYHGEDELAVICINIADFPEETRIIAEQLGITFPMVVDQGASFFTTYFNGAVVPTTIFITDDAQVAQVVTGPIDAHNIDLQLQNLGLPHREE